jgi:hypothetical protein
VDQIVKQEMFIPEEFEEYVVQLAETSESVGRLLKDLREPRTGGNPCIPWLGETEIKERVVRLCAEGKIAINLRGLDLLQAAPGESAEAAWNRMKGRLGTGKHLDETTIHRPNTVVLSGGVAQTVGVTTGGATVVGLGAGTAGGLFGGGAGPGPVNVGVAGNGQTVTTEGAGTGVTNLFGGSSGPTTAKKVLSAPPTSGLNLLGQVESWAVGPATPLTNVTLRVGKMTGAQLQQLLKNLPDGVTYALEAEKDA